MSKMAEIDLEIRDTAKQIVMAFKNHGARGVTVTVAADGVRDCTIMSDATIAANYDPEMVRKTVALGAEDIYHVLAEMVSYTMQEDDGLTLTGDLYVTANAPFVQVIDNRD